MGVPKFYRWISERYPCLSEVVKDYQIPDFDNLYLDMNGIIHNCSHPNDEDPHFRISEDDIFLNIFHYIEFLFRMIKPRKVFFMAVDGVAPRAKMNQQRGRRFRAAREAEAKEKEALSKGEVLPTEERFDSNCITPGTEFMTRLHTQLKYFVTSKISTDKLWQGVNVYLSGHETPGEGEHKVMDFIRFQKSQPSYDPDTKHCLYGLDADLIMLGLCSHEPHFSLLREEVKFGSKNQQKSFVPENITFHLLHLSLMREYLEHEFSPVKEKLPFPFDLEAIIDDWVLMGFLVGNDFIPNIPSMHIQNDALPTLYGSYIEVLPTLGGYINESGYLNLERFQKYLAKLGQLDRDKFSDELADLRYFEAKCTRPRRGNAANDENGFLDVLGGNSENNESVNGQPPVEQLLDLDFGESYDTEEDISEDSEEMLDLEFSQHKRDYYMNKLDYSNVDKEVLKEQAFEYVRAIQWNLHYYYNGIASWSWYYPHHYAPYISDVTDFTDIKLDFDLGTPFLPYEQLLAVLPAASKKLLPKPFQSLMINENSPVKNYYPEDFKTDLNGKQQEWEAVVLIPFIDEKLLLNSMTPLINQLSDEEKKRNSHGPHLLFTYTPESLGKFVSTNPTVFPHISFNHATCKEIAKDGFLLPRSKILKGLCPGVRLEVYFPGFPTLRHIEHTAELRNGKVKVFQMVSRKESMMLTVKEKDDLTIESAAKLIGKTVYVSWPHLTEAKVYAVVDGEVTIMKKDDIGLPLSNNQKQSHTKQCNAIKEKQLERFGIVLNNIDVLLHVNLLNGIRFKCENDGRVVKEKIWSDQTNYYPYQVIVKELAVEQPNIRSFESVEDLYPPETVCFIMNYKNHGHEAHVVKRVDDDSGIKLEVKIFSPPEPSLSRIMANEKALTNNSYHRGNVLAQNLGVTSYLLSRFTGTIFVQTNTLESMNPTKINIGLNLKFNRKNQEIHGYSKKLPDGSWLYSQKTLEAMTEYLSKFPELFDAINKVLDQDVVHIDSLFKTQSAEYGRAYIKKVRAWLETLPLSAKERQTCGAEVLDLAVIEELEKLVKNKQKDCNSKSNQIIKVSPQDLYRPHSVHGSSPPDPKTKFFLYDRVVHVLEGASVPLGFRGTVVGIHKSELESETMLDVLFDEEFAGALTLFCSSRRGYRLRPCSLMNLTFGQRMLTGSPSKVNSVPTATNIANSFRNNDNRRQDTRNEVPSNSRLYSKALSGIMPPVDRAEPTKSPTKKSQMTVLPRKSEASKQQTNIRMQKLKEMASKTSSEESMEENIMMRDEQSTPTNNPSVNQFNHSPDSPFVPRNAGWNSSFNFDSPSPDQAGQKTLANKCTGQQSSSDNEFMSVWDELKLSSVPTSVFLKTSPSKEDGKGKNTGTYGKQVSVEELFQTVIKAETSKTPKASPQQSTTSHCTQLLHYMVNSNKGVPNYSFSNSGGAITATLSFPTGEKFSSTPCSSNQLASESAAEQALSYLASSFSAMTMLQNSQTFQRPLFPPAFSTTISRPQLHQPMNFVPAPPRFSPPINNFKAPVTTLSMAAATLPKVPNSLSCTRNPAPSLLSMISYDFVDRNEKLFQEEQQKAAMANASNFYYPQTTPLKPNFPDMNQLPRFQPKPFAKPNVHQVHQPQQGFVGHGRGWAKGWQPSSPNRRKGSNDDRQTRGSSNRQLNNAQTYQAHTKMNDNSDWNHSSNSNKVPMDKYEFIPSQVARNQAGHPQSKYNIRTEASEEGNKQKLVKQMEDLAVSTAPDVVQSVSVKKDESEPVISHPKRKSRLAVKFNKQPPS